MDRGNGGLCGIARKRLLADDRTTFARAIQRISSAQLREFRPIRVSLVVVADQAQYCWDAATRLSGCQDEAEVLSFENVARARPIRPVRRHLNGLLHGREARRTDAELIGAP